jgi:hypothetical protein
MACCGAKTRSGEPCKTPAMENGRCRMHGGKAGKTHAKNQNATKHGIYGRVLTDEEKDLWDSVELGRVDDELKLCRLRLMRAIRAEQEAKDQPELDGRTVEPAVVGGVPLDDEVIEKRTYKRRDYAAAIDRLMGRIESLERTRADLKKSEPPPPDPDGVPAEAEYTLRPDGEVPDAPIL